MICAVWESPYHIASTMVNFQKRLALSHLLGMMQESAWVHADHLGQGYRQTHARGVAWVIVRQRVEMARWPEWEDEITVRTWLRPPGAAMVTRDFEFVRGSETVGRACAHWITIDETHRRPVRLGFPDDPNLFRQRDHLVIEPRKLPPMAGLVPLERFEVRTSDLDLHGHVNNRRFADWLLDSLPLEMHHQHDLCNYEIDFLTEVSLGETVQIEGSSLAALRPGDCADFLGRRLSDGQVIFSARLRAEPRRPQSHAATVAS